MTAMPARWRLPKIHLCSRLFCSDSDVLSRYGAATLKVPREEATSVAEDDHGSHRVHALFFALEPSVGQKTRANLPSRNISSAPCEAVRLQDAVDATLLVNLLNGTLANQTADLAADGFQFQIEHVTHILA